MRKNKRPFTTNEKVIIIFSCIAFVVLSLCLTFSIIDANKKKSITPQQGFPEYLVAPFIDMVSWVPTSNEYSVNGVANLSRIASETGIKYYNLGFIRLDDSKPLNSNGSLRWCWGGYYNLSEQGNDFFQYEGIKAAIYSIRQNGGDVIISVGGQLGVAPWVASTSVENIAKMYIEIIETYQLKRIDLDIEESNQGLEENIRNAQAMKIAQDKTGVEVVLTIPIMPYGWTSTQKNVVNAFLDAGVTIKLINNMTMCYGYSAVPANEDFADASIRAMSNAADQLVELYKAHGKTLTRAQAYHMMGATVDIGYENQYNPTWTVDLTKKVVQDAQKNKYGMLSFWSVGRDAMIDNNAGIYEKYAHSNALKAYMHQM